MSESLGPLDLEIDFSKNVVETFFNYASMRKRKNALNNNNYSKLKSLLPNGDIKAIHNCLVYAIHFGKDSIAKKIIEMDYDKNNELDINENHGEIFRYVVYYNRKFLIEPLIRIGADIHADEDYALIKYCLLNDIQTVRLLIKNGADVYSRNCLSLVQAAGNGNLAIVKLLLEHQEKRVISQISVKDFKPTNFDIALISAATYNHLDIVTLLLKVGADGTINNSEIFVNAAEKGNFAMVKIFLEHGLDPNILEGVILKKVIKNGEYELAKLLIEFQLNGLYVCDLSIDDSAYLRWAAIKGDYDIAKLLLESVDSKGQPRCDVFAADNDAHRLATKYNHYRVIQLLEQHQKLRLDQKN